VKALQLHHCAVLISDVERSVMFYTQVLGLTVDSTRPDLGYPGAWLNVGDSFIHLLQLPSPDSKDNRPQHVGRDRHTALKITGFEQLLLMLEERDISYTKSRSGRKAVFFRDPDGNGIECIADE